MPHRRVSSFAFLISLFLFAGCAARHKQVTNLPPGVTQADVQAWDAEVAALHKVAAVVSSLRQGVIAVEQAGAWPDTVSYVKALNTVGKMDQLELAASDFLKQSPQHFGASEKAKIHDYINEIGVLMDSLHYQDFVGIKNPDTKSQVTALVKELEAALQLAFSFAQ